MTRGRPSKGEHRNGKGDKRRQAATNGVDYRAASKSGCSSGKWGWTDDEQGRAGVRTLKRALRKSGGKGVREYLCPECGRWHVGHIPHVVREGRKSVRDIYGRES